MNLNLDLMLGADDAQPGNGPGPGPGPVPEAGIIQTLESDVSITSTSTYDNIFTFTGLEANSRYVVTVLGAHVAQFTSVGLFWRFVGPPGYNARAISVVETSGINTVQMGGTDNNEAGRNIAKSSDTPGATVVRCILETDEAGNLVIDGKRTGNFTVTVKAGTVAVLRKVHSVLTMPVDVLSELGVWEDLWAVPLEANKKYVIETVGSFEHTSNNAQIGFKLDDLPDGAKARHVQWARRDNSDGHLLETLVDDANNVPAVQLTGTNSPRAFGNLIIVETGGNGGTIKIQGGSRNLADAGTEYKAGSLCSVREVADIVWQDADISNDNNAVWATIAEGTGKALVTAMGRYSRAASSTQVDLRTTGAIDIGMSHLARSDPYNVHGSLHVDDTTNTENDTSSALTSQIIGLIAAIDGATTYQFKPRVDNETVTVNSMATVIEPVADPE